MCREKIIEGIVEQEYLLNEITGRRKSGKERRQNNTVVSSEQQESDDLQDEERSSCSSYQSGNNTESSLYSSSPSSSSPSSSSSSLSSSSFSSTTFLSFRAISHGHSGHLTIHPTGLYFSSKSPSLRINPTTRRRRGRRRLWQYSFLDLVEMKKKPDNTSNTSISTTNSHRHHRVSKFIIRKKKIGLGGGGGELELCLTDGRRELLKGMRERDSAFNSIIGFSSLQWQNLQIEKKMK